MYAVSEEFKTAIKNPNRTSSIYGTLTTKTGTKYSLNDSNIIKDSLYITNQIVNDNKLCFGAVYAGECGLLINSTIDRYSLFGAKIELTFSLNGEELPLGIFYVDTPERIGSKIKLTALDNMSKFDVAVDEDVNGSWYDMLKYVSDKCGVGLAQTQEELEALHVNATNQTYTIKQERIDTYRDVLSYMCTVICANATIDNTGKLKIVQYATKACDSNDRSSRLNNCKFSDYTVKFTGITARFFKNENYYPYSAYDKNIEGIILDCGDIPIVGGTTTGKNKTIQAMYETLKQIEYIPSTLYIASNPAYELGDMIECKDINNTSDSVNTYVMSYKFEYRKKQTVNCYGENPLLQNIKDKNSKFIRNVEAQMESKDTVIVNYNNLDAFEVKQDFVEIILLSYNTLSACRPIVICTVPFSIDVDGYVEFTLYNGLVSLDVTYKGYYEAGNHFATFMYLDNCAEYDRRNLRVLCRAYADTASATRVQDAKIKTLENGWKVISNVPAGDIFPQNKSMWEAGGLDKDSGANLESTARLRSYYVPIVGGQKYKCTADASHSVLTRHYTADKSYRGTTTTSFASDDFEFDTDATDRYIRFVMKNNDNTDITADELDSICWTCEPVIAVEDVAVDTTEPTLTIDALTIKAIAYTQGINGSGSWDGLIEMVDSVSPTIPTYAPVISDFKENVSIDGIDYTGKIQWIYHLNNHAWSDMKSITWNKVLNVEEGK